MTIPSKCAALLLLLGAFAHSGCELDEGGTSSPSAKAITSFYIPNLTTTVTIGDDAKTVEATVQWNADLLSLAPIIAHTGASIDPGSGVAQDFSSPVTYTVTAVDGTTQEYTVTVTVKEYGLRETGPAGGWIFFINPIPTAWKYLEAAPISTEWTAKQWGKLGIWTFAAGIAVGTGADNTALIVALLNQAPADSDRAAQLCDALVFGGYSDWFLPSKHEADMMCWNLRGKRDSTSDFWDGSTTDNPDVPAGGVGGFAAEGYWTSSENNSLNAWGLGFGIGNQFLASKANEYRVRAVRAF